MRAARLLLWLSLTLALAGCLTEELPADEPAPAAAPLIEPEPGQDSELQTLRWALAPPSAVVPPLASDPSALTVAGALFDGLTRLEAGEPVPAAAASWTSNSQGSVWTFVLRPDAVFHDGTPVTVSDVRFSWEEGIRRGRVAPHLEDVKGYDRLRGGEADELEGLHTRGPRTLHVVLEEPRADFAAVVAHPSLAPVPAAAWQEDEDAFRSRPIGNGPFEISEEWNDGGFLRARRSDVWENGAAPAYDELLFRFTDASTGFVAFQQGRVDIAEVPAGALETAIDRFGAADGGGDGARPGEGVLRDAAAKLYMLGMNIDEPPFDERAIRRALSSALDRDAIVERVPDANATPARSLGAPSVAGAGTSTCTTCRHAANTAQAAFEAHGIDRLELWINAEGGHEPIADKIAVALDEVGVRLDVRSVPFDEFTAAVESGEAGLFRYGWAAEHPTLEAAVVPLLRSGPRSLASGNPGGYANPDVESLLDEALSTGDAEERRELLIEAERLGVGLDQAVVPVMYTRHRLVVGERVEGFAVDATGRADLTSVRLSSDDE